ncbi:tetratricopeptide repeat protein [Candidatus Odyssella thessalonicensis]|uniref:tetratricopeptide repeat protein n=1 Tax=Candidatus Odyssella thessalonicensis TaxID=84647 RepID=UPI000225B49A|nr:tetratricopeptide repeat protein [Candidatus Odyssella thessalonicensis]
MDKFLLRCITVTLLSSLGVKAETAIKPVDLQREKEICVELLGLGHTYRENKSCDKAIKTYHLAAELGSKDAQTQLGKLYLEGNCAKKNMKKSVQYFQHAAEKGDADAQNNLAVSYMAGIGVKRDPKKAAELFKKAAEQGWSEAQFNLGICYTKGIGSGKDLDKAQELFKQSQLRGKNSINSTAVDQRAQDISQVSAKVTKDTWVRNWE